MAAVGLPLAAQSEAKVFAPFVSRLEGEVRNNLVRLSWADSADVRGPVRIYRSDFPFDLDSPLGSLRLVEIPYGAQSYIDEIESSGTFYYFASASDETGRSYDIPIPFSNTIGVQVSMNGIAAPFVPAPAPEGRAQRYTAGISSLEANAQGDRIIVTFSTGDARNATLYRSTRPIRETPDLLGAVIIQTQINSPYTDSPVPGIPYYYAVVAEEDLVRGTVEIIPGRNATLAPAVALAGGPAPGGEARQMPRPMPLPQITPSASGTDYAGIPRTAELSPQAAKALANIPAQPQAAAELKRPRAFARDLDTSPSGGEDYALTSIVRGPFFAKNWEAAREELARFLALRRSPEAAARARFYLGQCYYFLQRPREGLFEFLAIQDRYPAEAREWIQASLDMMRY